MNIFTRRTEDRSKPNRRDFLLQTSAASLGLTSVVNSLAQLKLIGSAAAQGAMWIMLQQSTASARSTGHVARVTSISRAGRTLSRPRVRTQSSMLARASASGSLG